MSGSFRLPKCKFTLGEFNAGDFEDAPDYGGRKGWHATLAGLDISDGRRANSRLAGEFRLRPPQKPAGGFELDRGGGRKRCSNPNQWEA